MTAQAQAGKTTASAQTHLGVPHNDGIDGAGQQLPCAHAVGDVAGGAACGEGCQASQEGQWVGDESGKGRGAGAGGRMKESTASAAAAAAASRPAAAAAAGFVLPDSRPVLPQDAQGRALGDVIGTDGAVLMALSAFVCL